MASEWLGLILTTWLLNPAAVVAQFGHSSYRVRQQTELVTATIGRSEAGMMDQYGIAWRTDQSWKYHVRFWQPITRAAWGEHPDPEVRDRAARVRRACRLYGDYPPGG